MAFCVQTDRMPEIGQIYAFFSQLDAGENTSLGDTVNLPFQMGE